MDGGLFGFGRSGEAKSKVNDDEQMSYDMWQTICESCEKYGGNIAYATSDGPVTYKELLQKAKCLGASLTQMLAEYDFEGSQQTFSVLMPNCSTHVDLFFAAAATRSKMVCLNHRLKLEELQVLFERGTSRLLIASSSFGSLLSQVAWASAKIQAIAWVFENPGTFSDPHLEQLSVTELYLGDGKSFQPSPVKEDTQLQGFFASGTTGVPKSVSHTHKNVHYHSLSTIQALKLKENDSDVWGHFGPLFHCGTPAFVWISVMLGARQVFHENQFQFMEVANMMAEDQVTIVKLMPTILKYLLSAEKTRSMKFEKLKWVLTGGMKPTADVIEQTKEVFGCQFIQGYGMTEATVHCSFKNESLEPMEDGMTVLPGLDLRVLDEADVEVPAGTVGEISIRGPTVFAGYDNNVEANAKAFTASGFFRSGDLGFKNDKGQLYISGRSKDMIIVGGENVFAVEVEQVIQRIPGVLRSAVFGGPDEALGEVVHCALMLDPHGPLVNLRDDEIEQKLCKKCGESLAPYKVPVAVHVWREEEFPMTGSGKPKKQEIRETCLAHHEDKTVAHVFASKEAAVIGAVASVLGRDIADEDFETPFMDLNMASMEFTRVINLLAGTLQGGELSPTLLFENDCLADLLKYIESREDLVLVQDQSDQEPPPDLFALACMEERPDNQWGQWNPFCLLLQLLSLLVRPLVLTAPVMFAAWAGWLWMTNQYFCADCYWSMVVLPFLYPICVLLLMFIVVIFKWLLIGQVRPGVIKLWSPSYYQWLTMYNLFQGMDGFLAMWRGTPVLTFFYNRCGAHISYQAEVHTSNLTDPDLLRIRQGAVVDRACNIQPGHISTMKGGHVVLGRVLIERDCYVGYGATIGPHVALEPGSQVRPLQAVSATQQLRASAVGGSESMRRKFASPPWDFALSFILYYIFGGLVAMSMAAGVAVMNYLPTSSHSHLVVLLPQAWTEGLTNSTVVRDTGSVDLVFWSVLPAVVFYIVPQAYFIGVVLLKFFVVGYATEGIHRSRRVWKQWLYTVLIDCPLFRLATQLTVMSHVTKMQFRLLGCRIGSRAYFCGPFIRDPELVEIGDDVIVAGNVALLTTSFDQPECQRIQLNSHAIVANTVVLGPGVKIDKFSIVGDGVCVPAHKELPDRMVAVRDNSDVMSYILMKRGSVPKPSQISFIEYTIYQVVLFILQIFLCVGLNVPGYIGAGFIVDAMSAVMPVQVGTWPMIPVLMLVIMTSKVLLIPIVKWLIACQFKPREVPLFGLRYVIWIAFEAVLFDADVFFLQTLCGTTFLPIWYRLMGARVGRNVCIMGSSVGCEYDLKHLGDNSVVNHSSLLFSHSVEKGTLIFRHTYLEKQSELGVNCVAEAGARVKTASTLLNGQVAHNADGDDEKESSKGRKAMRKRTHSEIVGTQAGIAEVTQSMQRGYRAVRNRRANDRVRNISDAFQQTHSVGYEHFPRRMSYRSQEAHAQRTGKLHEVCFNLDDFEQYAREMIAGPCFEYYKGGATDEWTLKENRYAFEKYRIIPRVLIPVTHVDMRCSFFGIDCRFPAMIAPSAMHGQAHPDAEKATARAAVRAGSGFTLSSLANMSMEDVANAVPTDHDGRPKGLMFQLYVFKRRDITELIVKKAEALGYKALVLTVDAPITGRRERDMRTGYATSDAMGQLPNIQMLGNIVNQQLVEFEAQKDLTLDWGCITWLKSITKMPVIAKGVMHPLDAREAIKAGAAAIVVSNHGGRQLDSVPATIDVLPAIAEEVRGEIPIFIDGGIRRGTDIFKAIGLGASAVMFARPAVYALAVGGEQGVTRMMRLLYDELETTMKLAGCTNLSQIRSRILRSPAAQGLPSSVI